MQTQALFPTCHPSSPAQRPSSTLSQALERRTGLFSSGFPKCVPLPTTSSPSLLATLRAERGTTPHPAQPTTEHSVELGL